MNIRKYRKYDCFEMREVMRDSFRAQNSEYDVKQIDEWTGTEENVSVWDLFFTRNETYVLEKMGNILAFISIAKKGGIDMLYVHKDYFNQGYGSTLLKHVEGRFEKRGIDSFAACVPTGAQGFFEKMGYEVSDKNMVTKNDVDMICVSMLKQGGNGKKEIYDIANCGKCFFNCPNKEKQNISKMREKYELLQK